MGWNPSGPVSSPRPSAPATSRHSSPPSDQVLDPALLLVPPLLPEAQLPPPLRRRRRRRKKSRGIRRRHGIRPLRLNFNLFLTGVVASLFTSRTRCLTLRSGYPCQN